jgi:hypothetical protein
MAAFARSWRRPMPALPLAWPLAPWARSRDIGSGTRWRGLLGFLLSSHSLPKADFWED